MVNLTLELASSRSIAPAPVSAAGVAVAAPSLESSEPQAETSTPGRASASSTRSSRVIVIGRGGPRGGRWGALILPAAPDGQRASDPGGAARGGVRGVLERVVERRQPIRGDSERGGGQPVGEPGVLGKQRAMEVRPQH